MPSAKLFQLNDGYLLYVTGYSWSIYDSNNNLVSDHMFPFRLGTFTPLYYDTILYLVGETSIYRIIDPFSKYIESIFVPDYISIIRSAVLYNGNILISDGDSIYKIEGGEIITTSMKYGAYAMAVTSDGNLLLSQPCVPKGMFGKKFRVVTYENGVTKELFRTCDPISYLVPAKDNAFIVEATIGLFPKYYICTKNPLTIKELGSSGFFDSCIVIGNICKSANIWLTNKKMKFRNFISDILPETRVIFPHLIPKKIK